MSCQLSFGNNWELKNKGLRVYTYSSISICIMQHSKTQVNLHACILTYIFYPYTLVHFEKSQLRQIEKTFLVEHFILPN